LKFEYGDFRNENQKCMIITHVITLRSKRNNPLDSQSKPLDLMHLGLCQSRENKYTVGPPRLFTDHDQIIRSRFRMVKQGEEVEVNYGAQESQLMRVLD
jgi:hypothetical protein